MDFLFSFFEFCYFSFLGGTCDSMCFVPFLENSGPFPFQENEPWEARMRLSFQVGLGLVGSPSLPSFPMRILKLHYIINVLNSGSVII